MWRSAARHTPRLTRGRAAAASLAASGLAGGAWLAADDPAFAEGLLDARRGWRAVGTFCRLSLDYKLLELRSRGLTPEEAGRLRAETHERGAAAVLELCRSNGGIFIKMGQHAASLKGAIPAQYIGKLQVLQDRAPRRSREEVLAVLYEQIGRKAWEASVESFDEEPVGCASLAQVHRAVLTDGREVAIKVQHHDLERVVQSDISLVRRLDGLASKLFAGDSFSLGWAVQEFEAHLRLELDFELEARNCERCRANFAQDRELRDRVVVPAVHWELTAPKVICMDFVRGVPIHKVEELRAAGVDPREVTEAVLQAFSAMIFSHGFVHADPHPGNLSVVLQPPGGRFKLALLDHGLYRELDPRFRYENCRLWQAMILQSEAGIKEACEGMGMGELWKLVPFLLVNRSVDTQSALGEAAQLSAEQAAELKKRLGISSLSLLDVGALADKLPGDMVFVLKVWHLIKDLNDKLGGSNRARFLTYARGAVRGQSETDDWLPSASSRLRWLAFLLSFYAHEASVRPFGEVARAALGLARAAEAPPTMSMSSILGERYQ